MSFKNYWARKQRANKGLKNTTAFKIRPIVFQKELEKAYDEGHREGAKMMKQLIDLSTGGEIDVLRKMSGL